MQVVRNFRTNNIAWCLANMLWPCVVWKNHWGTHTLLQLWVCSYYVSSYDVIKWKHFPRCWPFVPGIHRSSVNSPHRNQWRGAWMFSLICALNKRLSKQSWGWWFEKLSRSLWRHCNASRHPACVLAHCHLRDMSVIPNKYIKTRYGELISLGPNEFTVIQINNCFRVINTTTHHLHAA